MSEAPEEIWFAEAPALTRFKHEWLHCYPYEPCGIALEDADGNTLPCHKYVRADLIETLQAMKDCAMEDAERLATENSKLKFDLKCLEESTVDSKAYESLQAENEALTRQPSEE